MHTSIKLDTPIEFINITPINPLISKVQIKVCYVSDEPNRNRSVITKEVAKTMANSLPGSPIVGFYNEAKGDFEEHNRVIEISNGEFVMKDTTRPYGFVDLGAKVWFQKFLDDETTEREYLMTEGYIWTGQYPEAERIITQGNNQSMELDQKFLDATWTKDSNGKQKFFIINEAIISKLCILGEDVEPCFEGASIEKPVVEFSFDEGFKNRLFSMMNEMKELLEGGTPVYTTYAVEIGDALWSALYTYLEATYPDENSEYGCSIYAIEGIYEEEGQKFAILRNRSDMSFYRLNFTLTEAEGFVPEAELIEVTKTYVPAENPQFAAEAVAEFEQNYAAAKKPAEEEEDEEEEEETCPECGKPLSECTCDEEEEEEEKAKYSLEEIPEYVTLQAEFSALEAKVNELETAKASLENEVSSLREFKASIEKKEKEDMIESFYMLNEEDKADVIANIDTYSLADIEAKLSIICVRNRVNFNKEGEENAPGATIYHLDSEGGSNDASMPLWVKAVKAVENNMQ